jgi:chromosome segregation ATPase
MVKRSVITILFSLFYLSLYSMDERLTPEAIKSSLEDIIEALKNDGYVIEKQSFLSQHKYKIMALGTVAAGVGTYFLVKRLTNFATKHDVDTMVKEVSTCFQAHIQTIQGAVDAVDNETETLGHAIDTAQIRTRNIIKLGKALQISIHQFGNKTQSQLSTLEENVTAYSSTLKTVREQFGQECAKTDCLGKKLQKKEEIVDTTMMFLIPQLKESQQRAVQAFTIHNALFDNVSSQQQQTTATVDKLSKQTAILAQQATNHTMDLEDLLKLAQSMQAEYEKTQGMLNDTENLYGSFTQG